MKKLLVIGHVWPEPKTTAAGNRMLQLLEIFSERKYHITFASAASKTEYSKDLAHLGIKEVSIQLNDSSFDRLVKRLNPNITLFDRFMTEEQFGWRVAGNCSRSLRILNTEDLHSLREYRGECLKKGGKWTIQDWLHKDKTKREIASIYRSDLTLLVSSFEKKLLEDQLGLHRTLLAHLPFMLPGIDPNAVAHWPMFQNRSDFVSFGNGRHAPNVDSFKYLKETIWPLIRKRLPKAQLYIHGAYLPQQIKEMHQPKEGLLVCGWIENMERRVQKARAVLAPLRFGAGIKGKLALAMQNGTPSITTSTGMEGIATVGSWPGFVEDDPGAFAKRAVELYQDEKLWHKAQRRGINTINANFDKETLAKGFFKLIDILSNNLDHHRRQNFIGGLLQHQTMAATKFMGKWIEGKNRAKN